MRFLGGWAFIAQPRLVAGLGQACGSACPALLGGDTGGDTALCWRGLAQRLWLEGGHKLGAGPQAVRLSQHSNVGSTAASKPSCWSVGAVSHPSVGRFGAGFPFSGISLYSQLRLFLFALSEEIMAPAMWYFQVAWGLRAVVPRLWVLWLRQLVPAGQWTVIPRGNKGSPSSCRVSPPKVNARAAVLLCFALVAPQGARGF